MTLPTSLLEAVPPEAFQFIPHITLGQLIETSVVVLGFAWTLIRKYLRSEEDSGDIESHEKMIAEIKTAQLQLGNLQAAQQDTLVRQDKRLERVEDVLFFNVPTQRRQERKDRDDQ
jgi:hypothetical protein